VFREHWLSVTFPVRQLHLVKNLPSIKIGRVVKMLVSLFHRSKFQDENKRES